jgi:hypothetical protein
VTNQLFTRGKDNLLAGNYSWLGDDCFVALMGPGYTPNTTETGDQLLSDVPASAIIATSGALRGKTVSAGAAYAANVTVLNLPPGTIETLLLYATPLGGPSYLIAEVSSGTGLPANSSGGGAITIVWSTGPDGIFAL